MAIQGKGYIKTSWAFEERPVSSSKLNLWDDRIEAGLELAFFLLSMAWGGGDGVVRGAAADDLKVAAKSTPDMSVVVNAGYAFVSRSPFKLAAAIESAEIAAPESAPRIDLVQARLDTWDVSIKAGSEAATPSAPSSDTQCIALAELYLRPGMTCINDADDGTNGYVTDRRTFV